MLTALGYVAMAQPYPKERERSARLPGGRALLIRPIRPEDEALYPDFLRRVTAEDLRLRFFAAMKYFSHAMIARFTHLDYTRAMAFVAIDQESGDLLGVARVHRLEGSNSNEAEYAVLVRSDLKGHGLGWLLMQTLIDYARKSGIGLLEGVVLTENANMLQMCGELGFHVEERPDDPHIRVVKLKLDAAA
jgi:GNAT superfamily N-acetyltransferase